MNLYAYGDEAPSTSSATTAQATQPATLQPTTTQSQTTQSSTLQPTTTQSQTTQIVTTQLGNSVTTSTTSTIAAPTSLPSGWAYKGCWVDNNNGRAMSFQQPDDNQLTVESCVSACSKAGYSVAGMEYAYQCFCDNFLRNGATNASEADCSTSCAGNAGEKCGAGNRLSVYSNNTVLTVYPVPAVQKVGLPDSWQYTGCLADNASTRALPYQLNLANNNSANNCISQCSAFGYTLGGMEYGDQCCEYFSSQLRN